MRSLALILMLMLVTACTQQADDDVTDATLTTTSTAAGATTTTGESSTTTTGGTTTTTTRPSGGTTTTTRATTTTSSPSTTTTTIPADNLPPTVEILAPANLSSHTAAYDAALGDFGTYLTLRATASDPNGDPVVIRWSASTEGGLGTGTEITAWFSTNGSDATQPIITATAVDRWGVTSSASVNIIVWIPSDT